MTEAELAALRAAALERDEDEPDGHVCMTGDFALALLDELDVLRESEAEWQRRGDRAIVAERQVAAMLAALKRIERLADSPHWDDPVAGVGPIARAAIAAAKGGGVAEAERARLATQVETLREALQSHPTAWADLHGEAVERAEAAEAERDRLAQQVEALREALERIRDEFGEGDEHDPILIIARAALAAAEDGAE